MSKKIYSLDTGKPYKTNKTRKIYSLDTGKPVKTINTPIKLTRQNALTNTARKNRKTKKANKKTVRFSNVTIGIKIPSVSTTRSYKEHKKRKTAKKQKKKQQRK